MIFHRLPRALAFVVVLAAAGTGLSGQAPAEASPGETVTYRNPRDSTVLTATLHRPGDDGPHPGVIVLSIAGTAPLVDALTARGYVVLAPVRRGFIDVEPLLQATFADLASDVRASLEYLRGRPDVDARALAVLAQADDTPAAMLESVSAQEPVPLILFAPPAFPGVEMFRDEQRWLAARDGAGPGEIEAVDRYVEEITDVVLSEQSPYLRAYRLEELRAASDVELPRNAAFPGDERQTRFFASPLWHDRLAFEPETVLSAVRAPTLVLIGTEDPNTPLQAYLAAVRRGLGGRPAADSTMCLVPGRTRHVFTDDGVDAVVSWLEGRLGREGSAGEAVGCLDEASVG